MWMSALLPAAYSTHKGVILLDRKLGILYATCIMLVLGYVVGVRVIMERGYNAHEKSYGIVGARLNGTTYMRRGGAAGEAVPYDVASLAPVVEGNAIFLPTRIIAAAEQRIGNCTNPDEPCRADSDCVDDPPLASGLCFNGHCQRHGWCNAGGTTSQPADPFAGAALNADEETLQDLASLKLCVSPLARLSPLRPIP